jgi:hypothetical protein
VVTLRSERSKLLWGLIANHENNKTIFDRIDNRLVGAGPEFLRH